MQTSDPSLQVYRMGFPGNLDFKFRMEIDNRTLHNITYEFDQYVVTLTEQNGRAITVYSKMLIVTFHIKALC